MSIPPTIVVDPSGTKIKQDTTQPGGKPEQKPPAPKAEPKPEPKPEQK
jgi:hypothetical protein